MGHLEQTQAVQKAIRDGEHFSIFRVFVRYGSHSFPQGLLRCNVGGGVNFIFHATQFFEIAAARLAALGLKIPLHRLLNLNQPGLARINR